MELIQSIITEVNRKTGEAECQFYKRGLCYPEEGQRVPEIHASRFLYCHGELKSTKGQVNTVLMYFNHFSPFRHYPFYCTVFPSIIFLTFYHYYLSSAEAACVLVRAGAGFDSPCGAGQGRHGAVPGLPSTLTCCPDSAGGSARWRGQQFWILPRRLYWQWQR